MVSSPPWTALIASLDAKTVFRFLIWMVAGLLVYVLYSRRRTAIGQRA